MKQVALFVVLVACGGARTSTPTANRGDAITLEWKATQAPEEQVDVALAVDGKQVAIGPLSAITDGAPGTPARCRLGTVTATTSEFHCGGTPAYNFFLAELSGGELVISHVSGVDAEIDHTAVEERKLVKRVPVAGRSLATAPYSPSSGR
jgi:hypothetical protein